MNLKHVFACIVAAAFASANAQAALVSPATSVTAAFDVTGLTPGDITHYGYQCTSICGPNGSGDPENFSPGAMVEVLFGATAGGGEFGSLIATQPVAFDIAGFTHTLGSGSINVGAVSTIFITFVYVDDVFGVTRLLLRIGDEEFLYSDAFEISPSEVPLPAALPLFLAGLAGLGFLNRTRRAAAIRR